MSTLLDTHIENYERNLRKIDLLNAEQDTLRAVVVRELKELSPDQFSQLNTKKPHLHLDTLTSPDLANDEGAIEHFCVFANQSSPETFDLYKMNGYVQENGERLPLLYARFFDKDDAEEIHTYLMNKSYLGSSSRLISSTIIVALSERTLLDIVSEYVRLSDDFICDYRYYDLLEATIQERIHLLTANERTQFEAQLAPSFIARSKFLTKLLQN